MFHSLQPHGLQSTRFLCLQDFPGRILEWIAIPSSMGFPHPGIEPKSSALQADSLPSEQPQKPCILLNQCKLFSWSHSMHFKEAFKPFLLPMPPMEFLLSSSPQSCNPCNCLGMRQKKEHRNSDRDIRNLLDEEFTSQRQRSWNHTLAYKQQTGHRRNLSHTGEEEAIHYEGHDVRRVP